MSNARYHSLIERFELVVGFPLRLNCRPGKSATKKVREARYAISHVMKERHGWSYPRIARALGFRNHSSALYAHRRSVEIAGKSPVHAAVIAKLERAA